MTASRLPSRHRHAITRAMGRPALDKFVKRYTTLASALDILRGRRLTLLAPRSWDDTNDAHYMKLYREHAGVGSVLALCCTMARERYHRWRVFAQGVEGICIEFKREPLERSLPAHGAYSGPVDYETLKAVETLPIEEAASLAFLKREGYKDELEWRIIVHKDDPGLDWCHLPIELDWINRIILNPWLPESLQATIRAVIKSLPGCEKLSISASTLTSNQRWKAAGEHLVGRGD